jgi:hypothetical protein
VLTAVLITPPSGGGVSFAGTAQHIDRGIMLANQTFLVEFTSITNRTYYIQYSSDLKNWLTAKPAITGNGTKVQWIDNGEPKTISAPSATQMRFYQLIMLP